MSTTPTPNQQISTDRLQDLYVCPLIPGIMADDCHGNRLCQSDLPLQVLLQRTPWVPQVMQTVDRKLFPRPLLAGRLWRLSRLPCYQRTSKSIVKMLYPPREPLILAARTRLHQSQWRLALLMPQTQVTKRRDDISGCNLWQTCHAPPSHGFPILANQVEFGFAGRRR